MIWLNIHFELKRRVLILAKFNNWKNVKEIAKLRLSLKYNVYEGQVANICTDLYYNVFGHLITVVMNTNIAWECFTKENISEKQ